jgi:uncharacterized protein (TIGR01777 family)
MTILLSGASGMLGSAIGQALLGQGAVIFRLVRSEARSPDELHWNPAARELNLGRLDGSQLLTAAVHLSGANISSQRWTAEYKPQMRASRVGTTQVLAEALARMKNPPSVLVTASATGFYGDRGDELVDEDSTAGEGYFPQLCQEWEAAARLAEDAGIRVVHLRFGVVIGRDRGVLAKLAPLFRLGLGGRLGNGRQWMSWVSETDAVAAALFALENPALSGPLNVTSPQPVTNSEFTSQLARALHRPAVLPAPAFALRLAFGEMADEALLASTRAIPKRLLAAGFVFKHPTLSSALSKALDHS